MAGNKTPASVRESNEEYNATIKWSTVETRWDEKAGLRTGCGVRSQVIDVLIGTRDKGDRQ
jgi:hypothetical protein